MPVCGRGQSAIKFLRSFASLYKKIYTNPIKMLSVACGNLSGAVNITQVVLCARWMENIHKAVLKR